MLRSTEKIAVPENNGGRFLTLNVTLANFLSQKSIASRFPQFHYALWPSSAINQQRANIKSGKHNSEATELQFLMFVAL